MRTRADEVRKRIAKRKRERENGSKRSSGRSYMVEDEERHGFDRMPSYNENLGEGNHPLFRKEIFILKLLVSTCVLLLVAILFRNQTPALTNTRDFVKETMETEFQFAAVQTWYEDQFGKPLALFPEKKEENNEKTSTVSKQFAVPAMGKVLETFEANGQGVMIETAKDSHVEAMSEGIVIFAGIKEDLGKTVIIQHGDKSESWYGHLQSVNVKLYEFVAMKKEVGTVAPLEDGTKGSYYLAIKKGDSFIDPMQVIPFD